MADEQGAEKNSKNEKISIIGSGLIGRSWAMLFASVGYQVSLYDTEEKQVSGALTDIKEQLLRLEKDGLLRGSFSAKLQISFISGTLDLDECVKGAKHIQECTPEVLEIKKNVFKTLDEKVTDDSTVISSSTSCIVPSSFTADLNRKSQCLVSHPVNPPYYLPLVEIVPAPWTHKSTIEKTYALMKEIGQSPVIMKKELQGFLVNRIQYAILNQCMNLVKDDICTARDIDTVMTCGLGPRYAFIGPLTVTHLNAEGIVNYAERYSAGTYKVSTTFKDAPVMADVAPKIAAELDEDMPLDKLNEKRTWRDKCLMALAKLKSDMEKEEQD